VLSTGWLSQEDFIRVVCDEVPANVELELWAAGRKIWPPADVDLNAVQAGGVLEGTQT
jgi:hypothetical protein